MKAWGPGFHSNHDREEDSGSGSKTKGTPLPVALFQSSGPGSSLLLLIPLTPGTVLCRRVRRGRRPSGLLFQPQALNT